MSIAKSFRGSTRYIPENDETKWGTELTQLLVDLIDYCNANDLLYFNVRDEDYGAVGDGVADDSDSIQEAIDAAGVSPGGLVFIPPGTYKVTKQLNVNYNNVVIMGCGKSSIIKASAATFHVFKLYGSVSKIEIRDIQIQGAATDSTNGNYGIFTDSGSTVPTEVLIENVFFSGPDASTGLNNGIKIHTGGDRWIVTKCRFERLIGTASSYGYSILCVGNRTQIINNHFVAAAGQGRHPVYLSAGASYCIVSENNISGGHWEAGINIHSTAALSACEHNIVSNNVVKDCCQAGSAESGSIQIIGKANYNKVIGNRILDADTHGISISDNGEAVGPTGNVISSNYLSKVDEHGIFASGVIESSIDSNEVFDAGQASASTYAGIIICSYSGGVTSNKNRITNNKVWGTQLSSSIYINQTSPILTNTYCSNNFGVKGSSGYVIRIGTGVTAFVEPSEINVKDYGALGDGTTDDTVAIQAAIDACSLGGKVFFPSGIYKVATQLNVNYSNVTLEGEGKSSIIRSSSATIHIIKLYGAVSKIEIRNLQIQGAATVAGGAQYYGIDTLTASTVPTDVIIDNVIFSGPDASTGLNNGILVDVGGDRWSITNCKFEHMIGTATDNGYSIVCRGDRVQILNNIFTGSSGNGRHCVYLNSGASYCLIDSNNCYYSYGAAFLINCTAAMDVCEYNQISNNVIRYCSLDPANGEWASIQITGKANYNYVIGNLIHESGVNGIVVSDAAQAVNMTGNLVKGNSIFKPQQNGISIFGTIGTDIVSNIIVDASQQTANYYHGIRIASYSSPTLTTDKTKIEGNIIRGTQLNSSIIIITTAPDPTNTYINFNNIAVGSVGAVVIESGITSYTIGMNVEEGATLFKLYGQNSTGAQTATFTATNKPGSTGGTPATWLKVNLGGTDYYIPCWAS
jgi:hypothetical protein